MVGEVQKRGPRKRGKAREARGEDLMGLYTTRHSHLYSHDAADGHSLFLIPRLCYPGLLASDCDTGQKAFCPRGGCDCGTEMEV